MNLTLSAPVDMMWVRVGTLARGEDSNVGLILCPSRVDCMRVWAWVYYDPIFGRILGYEKPRELRDGGDISAPNHTT